MLREETASHDRPAPDIEIIRSHAINSGEPVLAAVNYLAARPDPRRDLADERNLLDNRLRIVDGERFGCFASQADAALGDAAGGHKNDIVAKTPDGLLHLVAGADADRDRTDRKSTR